MIRRTALALAIALTALIVVVLDEPPAGRAVHPWIVVTATGEF